MNDTQFYVSKACVQIDLAMEEKNTGRLSLGKKKKAETSIRLVEGVDGYTEVEQPESI